MKIRFTARVDTAFATDMFEFAFAPEVTQREIAVGSQRRAELLDLLRKWQTKHDCIMLELDSDLQTLVVLPLPISAD